MAEFYKDDFLATGQIDPMTQEQSINSVPKIPYAPQSQTIPPVNNGVQENRFPRNPQPKASIPPVEFSAPGGVVEMPIEKFERMPSLVAEMNRYAAPKAQQQPQQQYAPKGFAPLSPEAQKTLDMLGGGRDAEKMVRQAEMEQRIRESGAKSAIQKEFQQMRRSGISEEEIESIKSDIKNSGVRTSDEALKALRNIRRPIVSANMINDGKGSESFSPSFAAWVDRSIDKTGEYGEKARTAKGYIDYMLETGEGGAQDKTNQDLMTPAQANEFKRNTERIRTAGTNTLPKLTRRNNEIMDMVDKKRSKIVAKEKYEQERREYQFKIDKENRDYQLEIEKLRQNESEAQKKRAFELEKIKLENADEAKKQEREDKKFIAANDALLEPLKKELESLDKEISTLESAASKKKLSDEQQKKLDGKYIERNERRTKINELSKKRADYFNSKRNINKAPDAVASQQQLESAVEGFSADEVIKRFMQAEGNQGISREEAIELARQLGRLK